MAAEEICNTLALPCEGPISLQLCLLWPPLWFSTVSLSAQLRFRNIGVDNGKYLKFTSAEEMEAWGVN